MSSLRLIMLVTACGMAVAGEAAAGNVRVQTDSVVVPMDNVKLVQFKHPVSMVYVGNPSIAEVSMIDAEHAFVLGKRFGATNLIALSADKTIAASEPVLVSARVGSAVTVNRGSITYNYTCSTLHCETRPVPGDPKDYFDNTEGPSVEHEEAGNKGAGGAPLQSQH